MIIFRGFGYYLFLRTVSSWGFPAYGNSRSSVSEDELKEKHANLNGEVLDIDRLESPSNDGPIRMNTGNDSAIVEENSSPMQRGMVLPFLPLSLTFDNIRYSVDMPLVIDKKMLLLQYHHRSLS